MAPSAPTRAEALLNPTVVVADLLADEAPTTNTHHPVDTLAEEVQSEALEDDGFHTHPSGAEYDPHRERCLLLHHPSSEVVP